MDAPGFQLKPCPQFFTYHQYVITIACPHSNPYLNFQHKRIDPNAFT